MRLKYFLLLIVSNFLLSCTKEYLAKKPDKKLVIPTTLRDFQGMADYANVMNADMPVMGVVSSDNYYVLFDNWKVLSQPQEKNGYIWAKDLYEGVNTIRDWNSRYTQVFYANNILEGLEKIKKNDDHEWFNSIKGTALFFRAYAFFQIAQLFCEAYDKNTANSGMGIPLRLSSDLNKPSSRATVAETYEQILKDLNTSVSLLPVNAVYKTRPVKAAAFALLSRVYLVMQNYEKALVYADSVINSKNYSLEDFNALDTASAYPMVRYNSEVIFHSTMTTVAILLPFNLIIDSILYRSYSDDDLRKASWFGLNGGNMTFKGSYDGSLVLFNGLALDECYLTKAECLVRLGKMKDALNTLNKLLETRYKTGSFLPVKTDNLDVALKTILRERRKELVFRGIRWSDLRRLNLDSRTTITLYRELNGKQYELKPNSLNYTLPIQPDVIKLSGIPQNNRE